MTLTLLWNALSCEFPLSTKVGHGQLEMTWQMIQQALARWTPADLEQTFQNPYLSEAERKAKPARSRQWIIWHVLEHDLHHGGEVSQALGMHGLVGLDL
jgi:uncharacterized damage-inducible protein DinB